ncbi:MAG: hypothetical protein ACW98F_08615 [Candidatus Hodarchaeales archaeon]
MLRQIKEKFVKKSTILSFSLLYFLIFLIFSSMVIPSDVYGWISDDDNPEDDKDENGIDDDIEDYNERELQIDVQEDQVQIESRRRNETLRDEMGISFKISDGPEFHIEYRSESESVEREISLEVRFHSLIEFIDTNGNNIFDEDFDQEIQEYELDTDFTPIVNGTRDDGFGNKILTFNTTSEDGVFSLQFYVLTSVSPLFGSIVVPSEIKLDLAIINYPFLESTSNLALYIKLDAENEFEIDDQTEDEEQNRTLNEKEVEITVGDYIGFFSWSENAFVDGTNQTVYNSNVENDDSENEKIYLVYTQGNLIIHDPKLGFENITKSEIPFFPPDIIPNILSVLALPKENYLLVVIILTTMMVPSAWLLYRKNQV